MNASQDFMQMPHEGDESDSSSEVDDDAGGLVHAHSYSDLDSNGFCHEQKESSAYSNDESFDHDDPGNNLENVSCGDEEDNTDDLSSSDVKRKVVLQNSDSEKRKRK
jgi:hypothetical protein